MSDITLQEIETLIKQHGPTLYLHPDEHFKLSSFPWFVSNPLVYLGNPDNGQKPPDPLPAGAASKNDFLAYPWNDAPVQKGDMSSAVAYVNVLTNSERAPNGGLEIQFWFFYPFNGPGNATLDLNLELKPAIYGDFKHDFCINLETNPIGDHQGDWEHVSLIFDSTRQFTKIVASEHNYETTYYPPGTPGQKTWPVENDRPVLFASLNGHATFAESGKITTKGGGKTLDKKSFDIELIKVTVSGKFGLVNLCEKGVPLDCSKRYEIVDSNIPSLNIKQPTWLDFLGRCGWVDPPVGDVSQEFEKTLANALTDAIAPVAPAIFKSIVNDLALKIVDSFAPQLIGFVAEKVDDFNGPSMPKDKDDWKGK